MGEDSCLLLSPSPHSYQRASWPHHTPRTIWRHPRRHPSCRPHQLPPYLPQPPKPGPALTKHRPRAERQYHLKLCPWDPSQLLCRWRTRGLQRRDLGHGRGRRRSLPRLPHIGRHLLHRRCRDHQDALRSRPPGGVDRHGLHHERLQVARACRRRRHLAGPQVVPPHTVAGQPADRDVWWGVLIVCVACCRVGLASRAHVSPVVIS